MSQTQIKTIAHFLVKYRLLWLILIAFFLLSGCVKSDVNIRFSDANHGRLVQHIRLAQPSTGLEHAVVDAWTDRLQRQVIALGGRVQHSQAEEWVLTIPFFNVKDLETKFNRLLESELQPNSPSRRSRQEPLPVIASRLKMRSGNWVLCQRMVLNYEIDLRSIDQLFSRQKLPLNPRDLLNLEFSLNTGDAKIIAADPPKVRRREQRLIWTLSPGEINHLEAVFWVPSPIGMGSLLIGLLVLGGIVAKAQQPKAFTPS